MELGKGVKGCVEDGYFMEYLDGLQVYIGIFK